MIHWYEEQLQVAFHNLHALRHLPADTPVSGSLGADERALLGELLSLSAGDDPSAWLQRERLPLCACITLRWALGQMQEPACGITRSGGGREAPAQLQARATLTGEQPVNGLPPARHLPLDEEILRGALRSSRALVPIADQPPPSRFGYRQVLFDLIALPDSSDPLAWLRSEQARLCACIALLHLLEEGLPPRPFRVGDPLHIWKPAPGRGVCRVEPLSLVISEIRFGPYGFTLRAQVEIVLPERVFQGQRAFYQLAWRGFDRVRDLQGNCYPRVQAYEQVDTTETGRAWLAQVQVTFYPTPGPEADLIFASGEQRLRVLSPVSAAREAGSPVALDPFEWRADLASGTWHDGSPQP